MKLQRTGFTEGNLIFIASKGVDINSDLESLKTIDIQRMYSKAGFYDKSINGTYFDIDVKTAERSDVFLRWISEYEDSLRNSDYLIAMSHIKKEEKYKQYRIELKNYIDSLVHENDKNNGFFNYWVNPKSFYHLLSNKRVLVLSSFGSLINKQYESGNVHKIFSDFPYFLNLDFIDFPYTYFNNGPHSNFFETLDFYFELIKQKSFDVALVSCGPYGCIIVNKIVEILKKDAYTIGSGITPMFGIEPNRNEQYWVSKIPEEYIPEGFEKVEKGRYWVGLKK